MKITFAGIGYVGLSSVIIDANSSRKDLIANSTLIKGKV